ncbi:MAG: DUF692 domain-containing protein [Pseudomonadota bacterium]
MLSGDPSDHNILPVRAGVGLKPEHYKAVLEHRPDVGWFEVHPENYMGDGGPPHHYLTRIREFYPISLHGVGLSVGGALPLDRDHLDRLRALIDRYQPASFSEHLAWSTHETGFMNDLLPLPYTNETLALVCEHIDQIQTHLGRRMLLENPSTYVEFAEADFEETEFLAEIARRSGCGLLLDVNNVFVSCNNRGTDSYAYIDRFPADAVGEIHLAGHAQDSDDHGAPLLIDSHDREVIDEVWDLFAHTVARFGAFPTLVEWDDDIPEWSVLMKEAKKADALLKTSGRVRQFSRPFDAVA